MGWWFDTKTWMHNMNTMTNWQVNYLITDVVCDMMIDFFSMSQIGHRQNGLFYSIFVWWFWMHYNCWAWKMRPPPRLLWLLCLLWLLYVWHHFSFFSFCLINDYVVCQQWTNQWIEIVCVWLVCWSQWMKQRWRYCCVGANSIYSQFSSDQSIHFCCRLQI